VAAEAEVSEGYAVAFGAGDRVCGYGMEEYAWRVDGEAAGYAIPAAFMGGGIGIIASLLFPTREAPSLYAFSYATLFLDPVAGLARWRHSGLCRALQGRLEHAQSYRRQANRCSLQSV
jgi:hypothetical protein